LLVHDGTGHRPSMLEEHIPYLHQRWNAGCTDATRLWRELRSRGYQGGYSRVPGGVWKHGSPPPRPAACRSCALHHRPAPGPRRHHRRAHLSWSYGVVEGHVNRIKMLKRQMYGRAGSDLLCRPARRLNDQGAASRNTCQSQIRTPESVFTCRRRWSRYARERRWQEQTLQGEHEQRGVGPRDG